MKVPEIIEINTCEYLKLINSIKSYEKIVNNNLSVYMNIISKILNLNIYEINGECYLKFNDVMEVYKSDVKKLKK